MLKDLYLSINEYSGYNAFCINEKYYTYSDLGKYITGIQQLIEKKHVPEKSVIGLITNNDIETYASVFAIWFSGHAFVPLNPQNPEKRNISIIEQVGMNYILSSNEQAQLSLSSNCNQLITEKIKANNQNIRLSEFSDDNLLYIIFTSGSAGIPKGVSINYQNLSSYCKSFFDYGFKLNSNDRCLQIFELSFDASIQSYLIPLFRGACIYTVPQKGIKYLNAFKIIQKRHITFIKVTPSVIGLLKPYLDSVTLPNLRYTIFAGEALYEDIAKVWSQSAVNCEIYNAYGPTEATINCMYYKCLNDIPVEKIYNGIVAIGKPYRNLKAIALNEKNQICKNYETGELCIAGDQVTTGYWQNEALNNSAFVNLEIDDLNYRFYKTGDLVFKDKDGDFLFTGRLDDQVQIQGHRVELREIEVVARKIINNKNAVAIVKLMSDHTKVIYLFLENYSDDVQFVMEKLREKLPEYMIPKKYISIDRLPINKNGKIDRLELAKYL